MNRNVIIGVLVVAVLVLGGFYLMKGKTVSVQDNSTSTTKNPVPKTPSSSPSAALKPNAPVVITGVSPGVSSSTAVVSGQVKPNGALTSYWFEYGETTALGSRTNSQQIGSGYSMVSAPAYITGLKANTTYYFRLSANNHIATVNGGTNSLQTNNAPPLPGSAPSARTDNATGVSTTTATLNGAVNPNSQQTNFWFEYGTDTNLGNVTTLLSAGNGNSTASESASLSALQPVTKYYFRINSQNQFGTSNGAILNFTTNGPAAASAPSVTTNAATNVTSTGARMNGRINPNGVEANYWFEYSLDSLLGTLIRNSSSIQTLSAGNANVNVEQNLTDLPRNTTYYYRVVGRNSVGTVQGVIMSFKTKN